MKRHTISLAVILVWGLALTCAAQDEARKREAAWVWKDPQTPAGATHKTFKSATLKGQEVSYLLWTPPGFDPQDTAKRYPVAYFLHGGGGNYMHIPEAFLPQAERAIRAGKLTPFLGIVVNGLPSSLYVDSLDCRTPVESVLIKDLLPHVDATYPTSGVRLIEGFSMGGRGAVYLAFKYPDKFRGVADFSGAIHGWEFFSRMKTVAQLFPDEAGFDESWPFNLARKNAADIRQNFPRGVFIAVGDADTGRGNTYEWNRKLSTTLDELQIRNELQVVKGIRHSYKLLAEDESLAQRHIEYYASVFAPRP